MLMASPNATGSLRTLTDPLSPQNEKLTLLKGQLDGMTDVFEELSETREVRRRRLAVYPFLVLVSPLASSQATAQPPRIRISSDYSCLYTSLSL